MGTYDQCLKIAQQLRPMLIPYCLQGSFTSHGFKPIATQTMFIEDNVPFLRVGDGNWCPVCKRWSTIVNGDSNYIIFDKAAVLNHAMMSCGAMLYARPSRTFKEMTGTAFQPKATSSSTSQLTNSLAQSSTASKFDHKIQMIDSFTGMPLAHQPYQLIVNGEKTKGTTDDQGFTDRVGTGDSSESIEWIILGDIDG